MVNLSVFMFYIALFFLSPNLYTLSLASTVVSSSVWNVTTTSYSKTDDVSSVNTAVNPNETSSFTSIYITADKTMLSNKKESTTAHDHVYNVSGQNRPFMSSIPMHRQEMTTSDPLAMASLSDLDSCLRYGTCEFLTEKILAENRFCHCDDKCNFYGDCCINSNFTRKMEIINKRYSCMPSANSKERPNIGCFVINRCSDNHANSEIERKCNQNVTLAGPFVADYNGTIYKNRFCAECNGVEYSRLFSVQITSIKTINESYSIMHPSDYLSILLSDPDTQYSMVPPEGIECRSCVHTVITQNVTQDCKNYAINPMIEFVLRGKPDRIYRNQFCMEEIPRRSRCFGDHLLRTQNQFSMYPLSIIFSFSTKENGICNAANQISDVCSSEPKFRNTDLKFSFRLISSELMSSRFLDQVLLSLVYSIIVPDKILLKKGTATPFNDNSTGSTHIVELQLILTEPKSWSEVKLHKDRLKQFKWSSSIILFDSNTSLEVYTEELEEEYELGKKKSWRFNNNAPKKSIDPYMLSAKVERNVTHRSAFCTNIVVNFTFVDYILTILDIQCMEDIQFSHFATDLRSVITYTGCTVSVVALLISMAVSRKFGMSRSIPGNNLENLSIGLGLSNLIFMAGVGAHDYQLLCYVIGVVIHYLWLVSFSFMSIAVVFMCNNLTKMIARNSPGNEDEAKTKCLSTLFGIFLPTIFVLPSILLDYFEVENFSAEYDGLVCFPTGFLVNACFVSGPIILSVVVNLSCLIVIIIHVTKHSKATVNLKKSQSFQQSKVYIRICSFAGVFWLSGVLGAFLKEDWIDFIFIVLCSLQGLAVAVANLTTRRVSIALRKWYAENNASTSDESF